MKYLSLIIILLMTYTTMYSFTGDFISIEDENKKSKVKESESVVENKNFHSIRRWKMTIEYLNGDIISKTIVVRSDSGLSALETAFQEAENHLDTMENVRGYSVAPISNNEYVLLVK